MFLSTQSQHPAPLNPALLDKRTQESVRALMQEGSSPNTVAAYRAAIRYWVAWYALRYQRAFSLPLPAEVVVQFLTDHALRSTQNGLACDLPPAVPEANIEAFFAAVDKYNAR